MFCAMQYTFPFQDGDQWCSVNGEEEALSLLGMQTAEEGGREERTRKASCRRNYQGKETLKNAKKI